jgi:hypothetical protein
MNLLAEAVVVTTEPGYFVGWGTLSLVNAGLAQAKGRSELAWWLVSLLLGPLATFLIVVLERVSPAGAYVRPARS